MALAIFDLDHTLIDGDSDYLWGEYMVENNLVNAEEYRQRDKSFNLVDPRGTLDNDTYLHFSLQPLTQYSTAQLYEWRADYVDKWIKPLIVKGAKSLLHSHRERGDILLIISATNFFITEPIATLLGVPHLLSTHPEIINNRYTGRYHLPATFREGKITALNLWMKDHSYDLIGSSFYSDSINDLPLLNEVEFPITVNPDDELKAIALSRNWPILDLNITK
ncbi:MAG: HAD superfamily hydrolase (TIGR01490 family) [Gammaproteobacteria bacterium]|jgi:HAD superfamily hydrolase (TIGR01490 family)